MNKTYKGVYTPIHKEKYKGDLNNIIFRSSWELKLMMYLDKHPDIKYWGSETIIVPYISPFDGRVHRYFPDFWVQLYTNKIMLIEVKPKYQTVPPILKESQKTKSGKPRKNSTYNKQLHTWAINSAKWEAARCYCDKRNWEFKIMTEDNLY